MPPSLLKQTTKPKTSARLLTSAENLKLLAEKERKKKEEAKEKETRKKERQDKLAEKERRPKRRDVRRKGVQNVKRRRERVSGYIFCSSITQLIVAPFYSFRSRKICR